MFAAMRLEKKSAFSVLVSTIGQNELSWILAKIQYHAALHPASVNAGFLLWHQTACILIRRDIYS